MGTRQRSQLPIRDSRKHLQNPNRESLNDNTVPKDLEVLRKNKLKNLSITASHLRNPLTPLHRLRRFKEIRDRNLKKSSLRKTRFDISEMSVDVEKDDTSKGRRSVKEIKGTKDKISNGTPENGEKNNENSLNKDENIPVGENREVNGSPVKGLNEKPKQAEGEKPQQIDIKKSKHVENEKSPKNESVKLENEVKNITAKVDIEKEENENSVQEKEIVVEENKNIKIDKSKDSKTKVEIAEEEDDDIEVLQIDTDEEDHRDTDYESFSNDEPQENVKILRRSFRQELIRTKASTSTNVSKTAKPSTSKDIENVEKPKEKQWSLSPETMRRLKSKRVEGRRSLWHNSGVHRKRKYDDYTEDDFDRSGKKLANNKTIGTPSVLSPGWKFISSPFTRFWTPKDSLAQGSTPYKSLPTTPCINNDIEDSLAVNVDDKSLFGNLNDSELDVSFKSTDSTANNSSWRCNIM